MDRRKKGKSIRNHVPPYQKQRSLLVASVVKTATREKKETKLTSKKPTKKKAKDSDPQLPAESKTCFNTWCKLARYCKKETAKSHAGVLETVDNDIAIRMTIDVMDVIDRCLKMLRTELQIRACYCSCSGYLTRELDHRETCVYVRKWNSEGTTGLLTDVLGLGRCIEKDDDEKKSRWVTREFAYTLEAIRILLE